MSPGAAGMEGTTLHGHGDLGGLGVRPHTAGTWASVAPGGVRPGLPARGWCPPRPVSGALRPSFRPSGQNAALPRAPLQAPMGPRLPAFRDAAPPTLHPVPLCSALDPPASAGGPGSRAPSALLRPGSSCRAQAWGTSGSCPSSGSPGQHLLPARDQGFVLHVRASQPRRRWFFVSGCCVLGPAQQRPWPLTARCQQHHPCCGAQACFRIGLVNTHCPKSVLGPWLRDSWLNTRVLASDRMLLAASSHITHITTSGKSLKCVSFSSTEK